MYALCYTAPHVAIVYALIHAGVEWAAGRRLPWKVIAAAAAGVALGWLIHPSFPNNLYGFWVQIVGVLESAWRPGFENLNLGGELAAADTRSFLREHVVVLGAVVVAVALLPWMRHKLESRHVTLGLLAGAYFIMACASKRFVEYFVPVTLWACAELISFGLVELNADPPAFWRRRFVPWVAAFSMISWSATIATAS